MFFLHRPTATVSGEERSKGQVVMMVLLLLILYTFVDGLDNCFLQQPSGTGLHCIEIRFLHTYFEPMIPSVYTYLFSQPATAAYYSIVYSIY